MGSTLGSKKPSGSQAALLPSSVLVLSQTHKFSQGLFWWGDLVIVGAGWAAASYREGFETK